MANEWFQFATADHFWMQWRHRLLLRAIKRAGAPVRQALEIGCGNGVARDMLERDLGKPVYTAVQASAWQAYEAMGVDPKIDDCGSLLRQLSDGGARRRTPLRRSA